LTIIQNITNWLKFPFSKIKEQTGFFAPGPTVDQEQKITDMLLIRSANSNLAIKVIQALKRRFPKSQITMLSTWTLDSNKVIDAKLHDELLFVPLEQNRAAHKERKKRLMQDLKSRKFQLMVVIFSKEIIYYRLQMLPFILNRKHLLIYNENLDSFYFNNYHRSVILRHILTRLSITYILGDSLMNIFGSGIKKIFFLLLLPIRYVTLLFQFLYIYFFSGHSSTKAQ
jgi:hypothetical protein